MKRIAKITRKTKETDIKIDLNIDGIGKYNINTGIPFFEHMLSLLAKHSSFNLKIIASGDTEIDEHHLVEDVGICLGEAIKKCLGNKIGIARFGNIILPMEEALVLVSLDICNRPLLVMKPSLVKTSGKEIFKFDLEYSLKIKDFDISLIEHFFNSLVVNAGITLHINILNGKNLHHIIEAIFKGVAVSLKNATRIENKIVSSTKGIL